MSQKFLTSFPFTDSLESSRSDEILNTPKTVIISAFPPASMLSMRVKISTTLAIIASIQMVFGGNVLSTPQNRASFNAPAPESPVLTAASPSSSMMPGEANRRVPSLLPPGSAEGINPDGTRYCRNIWTSPRDSSGIPRVQLIFTRLPNSRPIPRKRILEMLDEMDKRFDTSSGLHMSQMTTVSFKYIKYWLGIYNGGTAEQLLVARHVRAVFAALREMDRKTARSCLKTSSGWYEMGICIFEIENVPPFDFQAAREQLDALDADRLGSQGTEDLTQESGSLSGESDPNSAEYKLLAEPIKVGEALLEFLDRGDETRLENAFGGIPYDPMYRPGTEPNNPDLEAFADSIAEQLARYGRHSH